jgi:hypothetical protein
MRWIVLGIGLAAVFAISGCRSGGSTREHPSVRLAAQTAPLVQVVDAEWESVAAQVERGESIDPRYIVHLGQLRCDLTRLYLENALAVVEPSELPALQRRRLELQRQVGELPSQRAAFMRHDSAHTLGP